MSPVPQTHDLGTRRSIRFVTRVAMFLALTLGFQMLGLPQVFTGPVVNTMLLLSVLFCGLSGGIIVGALTPWIAFVRGILPPVLAPLIPFIMVGNALYVLMLWLFTRVPLATPVGFGLGVLAGSVLKYLLLAFAVRFVVEVPPPIALMMQTPQLFTALGGGVVAFLVHTALRRSGIEDS